MEFCVLLPGEAVFLGSSLCWSCLLLSGGLVNPVNLGFLGDVVPDWQRLGEQSEVVLGDDAGDDRQLHLV